MQALRRLPVMQELERLTGRPVMQEPERLTLLRTTEERLEEEEPGAAR